MYSVTFRWTEIKDKILLREVRFIEPYQFKAGSKNPVKPGLKLQVL